MKTALLSSPPETRAGRVGRWSGRGAAAAVLIAATATAPGQGTVETLGGGPFQGSPSYSGYVDGSTAEVAKYNTPSGLALDSTGNFLFVADRDNNAVRRLNLSQGITETFVTAGLNKPVAVAVDAYDRVYVVNQGTGNNGSVLKFDRFRNFLGTLAGGLVKPGAVALDGSGNAYVTINSNTVLRLGTAVSNVVGRITAAGADLRGIAVLDSGVLALSDAGNHGIWLLDPDTGTATALTGFHGAGDGFGPPEFAAFRQPHFLAKAGGGKLVVADRGNHRVKVVDASGTVSHLYGVAATDWLAGWPWPGWYDGAACDNGFGSCAEAREPVGVVVAADGTVYSTEVYYHIIRKLTGSGLSGPGTGGGGGGSGTNIVVTPPVISPNSGYFPMGQVITVSSPNPDVFYTTDGTVPTRGSQRVTMNGNTGTILWNRSDRDLTFLRVRAYVGTNASDVVSGLPSPTNSIGVPSGTSAHIYAGVGSTLVVPVVANLRTNDRIRSLQYRVEVTPDEGNTNNISAQFRTLSIQTNDFVPLVTAAQGATSAVYSATAYATPAGGGRTNRGLAISAIGTNANVVFSNYAVVGMLAVPIPATAREGQTYSIRVLEASATADGLQAPVSLPAMPPATILVTNLPYLVGDASPGGWYGAGQFGNGNLDNADVNSAFYASLGIRVPHSFSDLYDAMDAFPEDGPGFVGGDGLIRYLDWQIILQRSLRLKTNNWMRSWSAGGVRVNSGPVGLSAAGFGPEFAQGFNGWYRQALVGALPVGQAVPNTSVSVPVYVQTMAGATLAGLQFRASVKPEGAAPALAQPPQFVPAAGVNAPDSLVAEGGDVACGWSLGTLAIASHSSNLLGHVRFVVPSGAEAGQSYQVVMSYADGAPDLSTPYTLETRSATVRVLAPALPATFCSDDWRRAFFADRPDAEAADTADPDQDGAPNWQEFLAGTHPLDATSRLRLQARQNSAPGSRAAIRWQTVPGRLYEVLQSFQPNGPDWRLRQVVTGDGTEAEFVETETDGAARFYRLRIQP